MFEPLTRLYLLEALLCLLIPRVLVRVQLQGQHLVLGGYLLLLGGGVRGEWCGGGVSVGMEEYIYYM